MNALPSVFTVIFPILDRDAPLGELKAEAITVSREMIARAGQVPVPGAQTLTQVDHVNALIETRTRVKEVAV